MKNGRGKLSGEKKMAIPRRHLAAKTPVSDVRDQAGANPACRAEVGFAAIMRGEPAPHAFRDRDTRGQLFKPIQATRKRTRRGARVGRLIQRRRLGGLIAKTSRTRHRRATPARHTKAVG